MIEECLEIELILLRIHLEVINDNRASVIHTTVGGAKSIRLFSSAPIFMVIQGSGRHCANTRLLAASAGQSIART